MRAFGSDRLLFLLVLVFPTASTRSLALGLVAPASSSSSNHYSCRPHSRVGRVRGPSPASRLVGRFHRTTGVFFFVGPRSTMASGFAAAASATSTALHLEQFAPQAVNLFNNMKTPASILAGALVPLGLLAPLPDAEAPAAEQGVGTSKNTKVGVAGSTRTDNSTSIRLLLPRILRRSYVVVAVLSLLSELISVMWATVAVNQLIETHVAPAESVWHLLRRDYDLAWLGTNAHFVSGMFGFSYVIALRAALGHAGPVGKAVSSFALAALLLMVAIVNRGVSSGSGDGMRYGASVASLFSTYLTTLFKRATHKDTFGPLEVGSMIVFAWGIVASIVAVGHTAADDVKGKNYQ